LARGEASDEEPNPAPRLCNRGPTAVSPRGGGCGQSGVCEASHSEGEGAGGKAESASVVGTQCAVSTRGDGFENTSVKAVRGTVTKSWQWGWPHSQRSSSVSPSPAAPNATSLMKRCLA